MKTVFYLFILFFALVFACTCKEQIEPDITYIDFNYVLPHDTVSFKTAEEEFKFYLSANKFKKEVGDHALSIIDIINLRHPEVMQDKDIQIHMNRIDSLFTLEL